jgi:tetratricopeptide (TPR) repeat protein
MIALAANWLGWTYTICGRQTEGQALLEEAEARLAAMQFRVHIAINALLLGEAAMLEARLKKALAYGQRAFDLSDSWGQPPTLAGALRLLGDIHALSDPPDTAQAEAEYRKSLGIANNLEARPVIARCHLGLGRLYRRAGKAEHAKEHLTIAAGMLREMDMGYWLDHVYGELKHF